jgi:hypothetical protein
VPGEPPAHDAHPRYGHVILHGFLFALEDDLKKLFSGKPKETRNTCHRDHIHGSADWMEWRAGFACGALLMPQTELVRVVKAFREAEDLKFSDVGADSDAGKALIGKVMEEFRSRRTPPACGWSSAGRSSAIPLPACSLKTCFGVELRKTAD